MLEDLKRAWSRYYINLRRKFSSMVHLYIQSSLASCFYENKHLISSSSTSLTASFHFSYFFPFSATSSSDSICKTPSRIATAPSSKLRADKRKEQWMWNLILSRADFGEIHVRYTGLTVYSLSLSLRFV